MLGRLIRQIIFILFILFFALIPGRDLIPEEYKETPVALAIDEIYKTVGNEIETLTSPIWAKFFPIDIGEKIIKVSDKTIFNLLKVAVEKSKIVLFYAYSSDCNLCNTNLSDIVKLSKKYKRKILTVAVAVESDKQKIAEMLTPYAHNITFKPLMMHPDKSNSLSGLLTSNGIYYSKPPAIIVADKNGTFTNVSPGFMKESKIEARIKTALGL